MICKWVQANPWGILFFVCFHMVWVGRTIKYLYFKPKKYGVKCLAIVLCTSDPSLRIIIMEQLKVDDHSINKMSQKKKKALKNKITTNFYAEKQKKRKKKKTKKMMHLALFAWLVHSLNNLFVFVFVNLHWFACNRRKYIKDKEPLQNSFNFGNLLFVTWNA